MGQWPQVVLQLVAAQLPQDAPPALVFPIFPAKADIIFRVRVDLHSGQATAIFSSRLRKRTSNVFPHFRHWNSYMGMERLLPFSPKTPASLYRGDGFGVETFSGFRDYRNGPEMSRRIAARGRRGGPSRQAQGTRAERPFGRSSCAGRNDISLDGGGGAVRRKGRFRRTGFRATLQMRTTEGV